MVAAATTSQSTPDQLETLLQRLFPGPVVLVPPPKPSTVEQLLQRIRRRDRILSTISDSVMVVTEELQSDDWTRSGRMCGRCRE